MKSKITVFLWLAVVVAPLVSVFVGGWLFWNITARPDRFWEEPDVTVMQAVLAALPFVVLARIAPARLRADPRAVSAALAAAAATGLVVTMAFWGAYYYDGYLYWKNAGRGGANIGLGLLMLASPALVGALMALAFRRSLRGGSRNVDESAA